VEAVKVLARFGADIAARMHSGSTLLEISIQAGHHQVAQVLRQLERTARAKQASKRAQQAARQDTPETREAAERVAAELMEEEEREEAAKVRLISTLSPPSPHIGLHSVQLGGERCGVSVARVSASLLTAWCARGMGRATA
jgi:biopolymer transport protein ExbB/TolQ